MSLKKVLYKNYGIVLKESESKYFNFLVKTKEDKSYKELLKEFSDNCTTRYFKRSKINLIATQLIKEEIARNLRNNDGGTGTGGPYGSNGTSDNGNMRPEKILEDMEDIGIESATNNFAGSEGMYIETEDGNEQFVQTDEGDDHVFLVNMLAKSMASK